MERRMFLENVRKRKSLPLGFHYTLMCLPGYIWLALFSIVPMVGIVMAFQNYIPTKGWFDSPWVGFKWFEYLWNLGDAKRALTNTLIIAVSKVILNIVIPMAFALMLNEVKQMKFKKTVQTIVYLPHFISWVILANIISSMLGAKGVYNLVRTSLGMEQFLPMGDPNGFQGLLIGTDVWKEFGYNAVIYLAALTGISPSLYEAAAIDGAGRFQRILHVTLPGIKSTFMVLLIMNIGHLMEAGFEIQYLMRNGMVMKFSDTIDVFALIYSFGSSKPHYAYGTAAGMFKSIVGIILLFGANMAAKALDEETLI